MRLKIRYNYHMCDITYAIVIFMPAQIRKAPCGNGQLYHLYAVLTVQ